MYNINNFQKTGMVYYFSFSYKEENRQTYDKIYYKTNKYHSIASKILVVHLRRICNPTFVICSGAFIGHFFLTAKIQIFWHFCKQKSQKIIKSGNPCRRPHAEACRWRWWQCLRLGLYVWCGGA